MKRKSTKELIQYVDITIHQLNLPDERINNLHTSCCHTVNNGMYKGVFANEILALDYAAFASVELRVEIYKEFLKHHSLVEAVSSATQYKADCLDAMRNKGNSMTITEAAAEISKLVGYTISCQWLNNFLEEDHYKFTHWYSQKAPRRKAWMVALKQKGYVDETWRVDNKGNKQKQCRMTSRGVQYIAAWLNKYNAAFPRKSL